MSKPITELAPLNIIRTETVLSKLPIHNLSRRKRVNIHITKRNEHGQLELYWNVSANEQYGFPGQLAYKLDTIIINRRIDESGRPLPKIMRLGSINEICKELGIPISGRTANDLKNAILQNAFAAITAKLTYKGFDGTERLLEAGFTRYSIVFTGEQLPNGKKADAVYLIFNEPYLEVLNNAPMRPLNYDYLKDLIPTAQRFYEIISYRMFVAIKYSHPQATLFYSDYCAFSAQNRYYDYDHFKKQMYKIHKPHLASGYIKKVEYEATTDQDGQPDWLMSYTPGPKAKAEYKAFNGKQAIKGAVIDINNEKPQPVAGKKTEPPAPASKPTAKPAKPSTSKTNSVQPAASQNPDAARQLVQHFHKLARNRDNYQPQSKEIAQAKAMLAIYGLERAKFTVAFAVAEAKKTNFAMRAFGAILQYVSDAIDEYERRRDQDEAQRRQEKQLQAQMEARLKALPKHEYRALYEKTKAQLVNDLPQIATHKAALQSMIKRAMIWELDKQK